MAVRQRGRAAAGNQQLVTMSVPAIFVTMPVVTCTLTLCFCLQIGEAAKKMPGSNGCNPYAQMIEDAEGLDKIESLQDHPNEDLYEKSVHILETYFDIDEGEDQNLAPQAAGNAYAFGAPAPAAGNVFNFGAPAEGSGFNFGGAQQ